jgi:hypothetical protein
VSAITREHLVRWTAPAPLWPSAAGTAAIDSPALLRFPGDSFMDDLFGLLADDPGKLAGKVAKPESARPRPVGADPDTWKPLPDGAPLKLFQPVHGNFYLVAASLVCRAPGLPDRAVKAPAETVGFVLRRLGAGGGELAWVTAPVKGWQPLAAADALADGEEVLPLFPVPFTADGRRRRLHVGLVPTSSRETYQAGPELSPIDVTKEDPRPDEFADRVVQPLEGLRGVAPIPHDQRVEASMFALLDFADFLKKNGLDFIDGGAPAPGQKGYDLYAFLKTNPADASSTWLQALQDAWRQRDRVNGENPAPLDRAYDLSNATAAGLDLAALAGKVKSALGGYSPPADQSSPVDVPKLDPGGGASYRLRCVYRRPTCRPPHADLLSGPSADFLLAPYFDPDAPSRPVRIPLPVDTSIAGLRKFAKSVAFLTSDKLRAQLSGLTDPQKVLKGEAASGPNIGLGEICSFSLPIITLCALIVLIVFIFLLNIVFWWVPLFRLCFPIPVKK